MSFLPLKLGDLLRELTARFFANEAEAKIKFDDPALEARHLVMAALNFSLSDIVIKSSEEVSSVDVAKIRHWAERRLTGYPLAYLAGTKAFRKSEFVVREGVLIPRPETELVVDEALRRLSAPARIADFGCGSGCIGLSLAAEIPGAKLVAIDASPVAVAVTKENAARMGLESRVKVIISKIEDWNGAGEFDLVVMNPPYIARGDARVQKSVDQFEPHAALYADEDGLACFRSWMNKASSLLSQGGLVVTEFGSGQSAAVRSILEGEGFLDIEIARDLQGIERTASARSAHG